MKTLLRSILQLGTSKLATLESPSRIVLVPAGKNTRMKSLHRKFPCRGGKRRLWFQTVASWHPLWSNQQEGEREEQNVPAKRKSRIRRPTMVIVIPPIQFSGEGHPTGFSSTKDGEGDDRKGHLLENPQTLRKRPSLGRQSCRSIRPPPVNQRAIPTTTTTGVTMKRRHRPQAHTL